MFTRFYRLSQAAKISGAVLLSALLLWATSGVQVASQQAGPGPVRHQILQHVVNNLARLTAAAIDKLNFDEAAIGSLPDGTLVYIPLVRDDPVWQLLFEIVWKGKPVGPVPIGMLYVDHEFVEMIDKGTYKLAPGYYWLKVDNDRRVIAEDNAGNSTHIGYADFGGFTPIQPQRTVRYFLVAKENPPWFALGLLLIFTAGAVTGCQINVCQQGAQCNNTQQNNPPQGGGSGQGGGGGGGGG